MADFKTAARLLAVTAVMVAYQGFAFAQMPQQQPDAKAFKLGKFDIVALHDAQFVQPNDGKIFGLDHSPTEVADLLKAAGAPTDTVTLSVDALLVKSDRHPHPDRHWCRRRPSGQSGKSRVSCGCSRRNSDHPFSSGSCWRTGFEWKARFSKCHDPHVGNGMVLCQGKRKNGRHRQGHRGPCEDVQTWR